MFSVNGLIIMFMFGYFVATIVETVKQEVETVKQDLKAKKDIKDLENIFLTVWEE